MGTRRDFVIWSGRAIFGGLVVGALLPALEGCVPTSFPTEPSTTPPPGPDGRIPVDVADLSAANPLKLAPGMTGSDGMPVLLSFVFPSTYYALSSNCPHAACQVQSQASQGEIPCLCHGSRFGLDGSLKLGPAATGLKQYDAIYDAANKQLRIKLT